MEAWMQQAQELIGIQGSDEQRAHVRAYEADIIRLKEIESVGGPGSALLTEHPLVVGRVKILRRRASRLKASAA